MPVCRWSRSDWDIIKGISRPSGVLCVLVFVWEGEPRPPRLTRLMTPFLPGTDSSITAASIASLVSSCRLQGSTLVPFLFPPSVVGFRWEFMSLGSFFMASSLPERWELPWRHRWAPESWGGWDWRCFVLAWNSEVIYQSVSDTTDCFRSSHGTKTIVFLAILCSTKSVHLEFFA